MMLWLLLIPGLWHSTWIDWLIVLLTLLDGSA